MKPISEIIFGFSDAENYRRRENKELFNKFFVRTTDWIFFRRASASLIPL